MNVFRAPLAGTREPMTTALEFIRAHTVHPELVITFDEGTPALTLPAEQRALAAEADVLGALAVAAGDPDEGAVADYDEDSLLAALEQLRDAGLLIPRECRDGGHLADAWRDWGPPAWFFHLMTKDLPFTLDEEEQHNAARATAAAAPAPSPFKCMCGESGTPVNLPRPSEIATPLTRAMLERRTCRSFAPEPISAEALSNLLFYMAGYLFEEDVPYFGTVVKKCAPSGGARHSLEVYPIVSRVAGVAPGVYHYCPRHHALATILETDGRDFLLEATLGQEFFADAAVGFVLTCSYGRLVWRYKSARLYRVVNLETGLYSENLLLTAAALGLGSFLSFATHESTLEERLGLDGRSEFVTCVAGAGVESGEHVYEPRRQVLSPHLPQDVSPKLA
jgi:SagB-type dehydrogenase family enzyme